MAHPERQPQTTLRRLPSHYLLLTACGSHWAGPASPEKHTNESRCSISRFQTGEMGGRRPSEPCMEIWDARWRQHSTPTSPSVSVERRTQGTCAPPHRTVREQWRFATFYQLGFWWKIIMMSGARSPGRAEPRLRLDWTPMAASVTTAGCVFCGQHRGWKALVGTCGRVAERNPEYTRMTERSSRREWRSSV